MTTLTIVRGLPGSGKSTFAKSIGCLHVEADMYHMDDGKYTFEQDNASIAHDWCYSVVDTALDNGIDVVVSNTFTKLWELQRYIDCAARLRPTPMALSFFSCRVDVYTCTGDFGSKHNVPKKVIDRMRNRWEKYPGEIFI